MYNEVKHKTFDKNLKNCSVYIWMIGKNNDTELSNNMRSTQNDDC